MVEGKVVVVAGSEVGRARCFKRRVQTAARRAKCHLNPAETVRSTAKSAFPSARIAGDKKITAGPKGKQAENVVKL